MSASWRLLEAWKLSQAPAPLHGAEQTLDVQRDTFWSSTGSGPERNEFLLYTLKKSLCCVRFVRVAVERATFQPGCALARNSFPRAVDGVHLCAQLWVTALA
jgi:hypothetical protein